MFEVKGHSSHLVVSKQVINCQASEGGLAQNSKRLEDKLFAHLETLKVMFPSSKKKKKKAFS